MARIVIVGGGFAGAQCARTLSRALSGSGGEVVLFSRENHLVFQPLLAEVVGASLNDEDVMAPLRQMLPRVRCRTEEVVSIDLGRKEIEYCAFDEQHHRLSYDHVVLACGNVVNLGMVPGMADHAFPLKTIGDAMAIRAHVMDRLEQADVCDQPERRRWLLSFLVVGGGYSGVETAGEINDLVRSSRRFYRNIRAEDISVSVIHSRDQLLPEIGPSLREFARAKMEKAGIRVVLNARAAVATPEGVGLVGGQFLPGATIVCTIGTATAPIIEHLDGAAKDKGRLLTEPDMRLRGHADAWAVGDCAQILNAHDGQPSPPTGQFAEREGRQAAQNIVRTLRGEPTVAFRFKPLGQLCSIGGHTAVVELFGRRMSGFLAWFLWRGVYLFKLPTWSRRLKVGFDWAWQLLFPRDVAYVKPDQTDRVSRAYYKPGDYVFHQGDPATNFYVIETGEAEVVRETQDGGGVPAAVVLGPGSFFGEMALLEDEKRSAGVRARSALELTVIGRTVFNQISGSLGPLRELLLATIQRRRELDFWQRLPAAREILQKLPLAEFIEPAPQPLLGPDQTLEATFAVFDAHDLDIAYVSGDGKRLDGLVTRSDLFRALNVGCTREAPVRQFMCKDPVVVTPQDTTATAAATLRDQGLKWVPVVTDNESRSIAGCVRAQALITRVFHDLPCEPLAKAPENAA
jgi:NADH:quinone reductase (non-electrogenic)